MSAVLIDVQQLEKKYSLGRGFLENRSRTVWAVDGIDLKIYEGETLGLVGESGCGKSTLARLLMRLEVPDAGHVFFKDENIFEMPSNDLKNYRRRVQMIFQDPYSSLNPRKSALHIVQEPLNIHHIAKRDENRKTAVDLMIKVGLTEEQSKRYPHEFSGGQRQRIGIARALALKPALVVADEPVSALDASIQAQILNLLKDLKKEFGLTYLFISHDLNVIRHVSDRIAVMYLGRIVELADRKNLFQRPLHPYTQMLLSAMPSCGPQNREKSNIILGEPADRDVQGCNFKNRCIYRIPICDEEKPVLTPCGEKALCACHRAGEI
ncbi:MAG: ATP-binding cassette domain-containing protein [Deltaproteobacteria bacterium]|nr:ATP-binding cassette domain-containing protein [Deltaproteobacteria bacterium]